MIEFNKKLKSADKIIKALRESDFSLAEKERILKAINTCVNLALKSESKKHGFYAPYSEEQENSHAENVING